MECDYNTGRPHTNQGVLFVEHLIQDWQKPGLEGDVIVVGDEEVASAVDAAFAQL